MATWYIDEYAYNSNFTKEIDERVHQPEMFDQSIGLKPNSSIFAGRVHGNPHLEESNLGWQDSPGRMREQDEIYRAAITSGNDSFAFKALFSEMPDIWERTGGFHIMDADDPLLVEKGEAFIHKQFTDYMAEHVCASEQSSDEWDKLCSSYLFKNLVNNIAIGVVPAGVVVEPVRQLFGLPYEWHGAPIE